MMAATRTGNYTFMSHWFLIRDDDGTIRDATEDQPEGSERSIEVEFDFSAEEPMVMHDRDGGGYPGSPAECDITKVRVLFGGEPDEEWVDLPMELVNETMGATLTEQAWEYMKEQGDDPYC